MSQIQLQQALQTGLEELHLQLSALAQTQLLQYLQLLYKWNQAYNLTAVTELSDMVTRHLLDCLAILPLLPAEGAVLDVGTGAGLPGLVLAISRPDQHFYLLDSLRKRTIFLEKVVRELQLTNVTIINSRVDEYQAEFKFPMITSRAFSSLKTFAEATRHLADDKTLYLALKGKLQPNEIADMQPYIMNFKAHPLNIPHLNAERHLLTFTLSY